ncbi:MAG TPA: 4Fe-4S ferredoxin [Methanobacterium sp.]|nr:4Fe-4S ferredoxin [Methanobacterium sp.]
MKLEDQLRNIIEEECEDYFFGVVDLSNVENDMIGQYESFFDEYPRAISIGVTIPYMVTDELLKSEDTAIYKETNCKLRIITAHLNNLLQNEGYKVLSVPKAKRTNDETFISLHKLAANLADLGEIEKNLVVTPEVGPGVNWGTILTNAPVEASQ